MKSLKKILFFFLLFFSFSFSLENGEESKVVLQRRREAAQMKIGVTKIKSKELPLEFHINSKKIYGEIDIDDNDLVFVSETLDEIPSVSTTNGRKSINNIKKYMTKEIKKASKFEYQIVEKKSESDKGNDKKYILIDCKEQLSGVYIYVVEKESYKVKEVYKGVFAQLFEERSTTEYGTISINENFLDKKNYRKIFYNNSIKVANIDATVDKEVDEVATSKVSLEGKYPEKIADGKKYNEVARDAAYKIEVYKGSVCVGKTEVKYLEGPNYNILRDVVEIESSLSKVGTKLIVETVENSKYYNIYLSQPYPYEDANFEVRVIYGSDGLLSGFHERDVEKFYLKIAKRQGVELPEDTEGTAILQNVFKVSSPQDTFLSFDDENRGSLSGNLLKYNGFIGKAPEILDLSIKGNKENFPQGNKNFLRISYKNNFENEAENTASWHKKIYFNDKIDFDYTTFSSAEGKDPEGTYVYNRNGLKIGKISIEGKAVPGEKKYFKIKFHAVEGSTGKLSGWENETYREVASTLEFEYVTVANGTEKTLKRDKLNLVVQPIKEKLAPETRGTLLITKSEGLAGHDLFLDKNGKITAEGNSHGDGSIYTTEGNVEVSGKIPVGFASNAKDSPYWVNMEKGYRLIIKSKHETVETTDVDTGPLEIVKGPFDYKTGSFRTKHSDSGWFWLYSDKNRKIGKIYISYDGEEARKSSITIGFKNDGANFEWEKGERGVFEKFEFQYQVQEGVKDRWKTIKTDVLELIIQPDLDKGNPEIRLANPLVYYDYDSSKAISNIVHDRRAHLSSELPKTLNNSGSEFRKNTDLDGKDWIETSNITDYSYHKKHKISITRGTDEVLKNTTDNGGTKSSTYLSGTKVNKENNAKNEVMFSYDGGSKYLNFGVSKYNFEGEEINDVVISHFNENGGFLEERRKYTVKIPRFEGIHYAGNYDIKPRQSYTKDYAYDPNIPYNEPIIIDYGTVGFRNLDIRITEQSKGEGIDFRARKKVKLVSEKNPDYVIHNVEFYFENGKMVSNDDQGKTTIFKGEDEKATSAMLKLRIPRQETLIPQGRFIILTDDGPEDENNNPLRIGVTVNNDKKSYYTYIDDEKEGSGGKNLYLNLTTNRFVETIIEFENPNLNAEGGENWIKLNKSQYSEGHLSRPINSGTGSSNLWGRVRGDIIDIPVKKQDGITSRNLKMTLFDKNNNILIENLNEFSPANTNKYKFKLKPDKDNKERNFIISRKEKDDNFIRFTLDNGYDPTPSAEDGIEFYIRYIDISEEGKEDFLFDQRYIVKFKTEAKYKGDIDIRFKNPTMTIFNNDASKKGVINLYEKTIYAGSGNHDTEKDKIIDWVEVKVKSSSQKNVMDQIKNDFSENYTLEGIGEKNDAKGLIMQLNKTEFLIGLPETKTEFEKVFGTYTGKKIDKSFELKFNNDNNTAYRLNIIIDEFNPRYYGKVYLEGKEISSNEKYEEINNVGEGRIDLTNDTNPEKVKYVYVDLGTSYRNYMRYRAVPTSLFNHDLFISTKKVEAIPENLKSKVVKGDLVLYDKDSDAYIDLTKNKIIEFANKGTSNVKEYPLKLKLEISEYKKLRPYTKYNIFLDGDPNVLTIGTSTLNKNILFNKPLSFYTEGPRLKITTSILDFGEIKPKIEKEKLIKKHAKAEINVELIDTLDPTLSSKRDLVPETDTIFINQVSSDGTIKKNGGKLKVGDLKTTKIIETHGAGITLEVYEIEGILEVDKDIPKENYGEYKGKAVVEYTFY